MDSTLTLVGLVSIRSEWPLVIRVSTMVAGIDPVGRNSSIRVRLSGSSLVGVVPSVGLETRKLGSRLSNGDLLQHE